MPNTRSHRPSNAPHLRSGRAAERDACAFLEARGVTVLARNVRLAAGEIDIVAREGDTLLFVEVRWRRDARHGGALGSIDWRKQARLQRAVGAYLQRVRPLPPCRIDALCRDGDDPRGWRWIRGL